MNLYLIAEIGINHNGNLNIAKRLIKEAADAGFDAVKFQKRTIDKVYTKTFLDSPRASPWGTTQRDQKLALEFDFEDYEQIDDYCKENKIAWSASAWDPDAQYFLRQYDLAFNKVASAMLGHKRLLKEIASEQRKTFISTGMANLDEIDEAVELFTKMNCPFELMHCNSTYPMEEKDANLHCISMLRSRYNCDVGYSGHESALLTVSTLAVALGATSIERHVTLDRTMYGSDQAASIEAHALKNFVETLRHIPTILGNGEKYLGEAEQIIRQKLRVDAAA